MRVAVRVSCERLVPVRVRAGRPHHGREKRPRPKRGEFAQGRSDGLHGANLMRRCGRLCRLDGGGPRVNAAGTAAVPGWGQGARQVV